MAELGLVLLVGGVAVLELHDARRTRCQNEIARRSRWQTNLVVCTVLVRSVVEPTHDDMCIEVKVEV